jgi:hypothetical protein
MKEFDMASDAFKGEPFEAQLTKRKTEGGRDYLRLE